MKFYKLNIPQEENSKYFKLLMKVFQYLSKYADTFRAYIIFQKESPEVFLFEKSSFKKIYI